MQVVTPIAAAVTVHQSFSGGSDFKEIASDDSKFEENFSLQLKLNEDKEEDKSFESTELPQQEEDDSDEEFSFACVNPDGSPVSADDIFQDGQIRPFFPLFDRNLLFDDDDEAEPDKTSSSSTQALRPPLKKLFIEERDRVASSETEEPDGPFCAWAGKAVDTSPGVCKKSNSTGFSKLRRFRELVLRSNSDGKDAFIFLHHKGEKSEKVVVAEEEEKKKTVATKKKNKKRNETVSSSSKPPSSSSAHERLYVRNRAIKEEHKRKSYLPYRVGFFTNVNGLSRNVHPY